MEVSKAFSTNLNRNKDERLSGHGLKDASKKIPLDAERSPTTNIKQQKVLSTVSRGTLF